MGYRNLLDVSAVAPRAGQVSVCHNGVDLAATALVDIADGPLIAAFKPDDVTFADQGLPATVDSVIYGGRESMVKLTLASGGHIHARVADKVRAGDRVHVAVPADHLLVYPRPAHPIAGL
ncbi:TOBE domain-containing protein [Kaistia terrae]|nr:TOBE domain-containing protein [Kaistia terrae]